MAQEKRAGAWTGAEAAEEEDSDGSESAFLSTTDDSSLSAPRPRGCCGVP